MYVAAPCKSSYAELFESARQFVGIRVSVLLPDLTHWTDMEFVLDAFAWAHLTAGCGIIVFFLINLMTHPGRYGPATTAAQTVSADAVLNNSSKS